MTNRTGRTSPRTVLLDHLRSLRSPPYVDVAKDTQSNPQPPRYQDSEAQCEFWGAEGHNGEEEHGSGVWTILYTFVQVLLVLIIALNIDVFLSRWGASIMSWNVGAQAQDVQAVQLHFCLTNEDTHMHGPLAWRLTSTDLLSQCLTRNLTLNALPSEALKIDRLSGILVEISEAPNSEDIKYAKFVPDNVQEAQDTKYTPDNPVGEEKLEKAHGTWMRAGFGGEWRRRIERNTMQ